jgi:hypothetical protein
VARERDRLRQRLLESRGWRFHRIWSTDWFNDCPGEIESVIADYEDAIGRSDEAQGDDAVSTGEVQSPPEPETPSWTFTDTERKRRKPPIRFGAQITEYSDRTLLSLVLYVRSDGVLRTREDEFRLLMSELGLKHSGSRIRARLHGAQDTADRMG